MTSTGSSLSLGSRGPRLEPSVAPLERMLRASAWAKGLDAGQMDRVLADVTARRVAAGALVSPKGERRCPWLGVVDGLVKISSVSPEGKSVTFTGVSAGGWFGEGTILKDEPRKYDVVAMRDSCIAQMPPATFLWLLDQSVAFNRFLLTQLNERLGQFLGTVEFDRLLGPDARIARCLAELFNPHLYPGVGNRLEISQEEIGYLCGTSRQRTCRALHHLQRSGLLTIAYGAITILDLEGLRRFRG